MTLSTTDQSASLSAMAVAEIAHELRSPLGGIEAMAMLLSQSGLSAQQQRLVDGLCAAAGHLRSVASDFLDAQSETGKTPVVSDGALDLRAFIDMLAVSAEARARSKGLSFALSFDATIAAPVQADARRIRQMLENLLDNAIKVTTTGGIRLAVSHVDRRGVFEGLRFVVEDTGPGFSAEQASKLFRHFGRLDNGVAGTGIGLAMVRRLANAMGGEAGCEGWPGKGASFWFTLRLKMPKEPGHDGTLAETPPSSGAMEGLGRRILVVDDNQANRMIMGAVLEHFGFEMAEAETAEQALSLLPGGSFAALMMDQTLPGMSGLQALQRIRAMPEPLASLPVIPVTGRVSASDKAAFAAAGANGFVEKPITARAVRVALEAALATVGQAASEAA